jgi:hypothetical protein
METVNVQSSAMVSMRRLKLDICLYPFLLQEIGTYTVVYSTPRVHLWLLIP